MSWYNIARYSTSPDAVRFACMNGITQNPLYMQCDLCGNDICHIRQNLEDNADVMNTVANSKKMLKLMDEMDALQKYFNENPLDYSKMTDAEYFQAAEERNKRLEDIQRKIDACVK